MKSEYFYVQTQQNYARTSTDGYHLVLKSILLDETDKNNIAYMTLWEHLYLDPYINISKYPYCIMSPL